ncbi:MAG: hypothetical protein AAF622_15825, partial [Cyanobacteria bacterium P01_C01_bin.147]
MRHRFSFALTKWLRDSVLVALCLLGSGVTAMPVILLPPAPAIAQTLTDDEQADLERLQQEANLAFTRATTLVAILLTALALLLVLGVIMLWFLRRSVVQEVATAVRTQLNQMSDLEHKIRTATRELSNVLKDAEDISGDIEQEAEGFKDLLTEKRRVLNQALTAINDSKASTLEDWEQQVATLSQTLADLEANVEDQAALIKKRMQARAETVDTDAATQTAEVLASVQATARDFQQQLTTMTEQVTSTQGETLSNMATSATDFATQMQDLTTAVAGTRDRTLADLAKLQEDFAPYFDTLRDNLEAQLE